MRTWKGNWEWMTRWLHQGATPGPLAVGGVVGMLVVIGGLLLPFQAMLVINGLLLSLILGLIYDGREARRDARWPASLDIILRLARDAKFFDRYQAAAQTMLDASQNPDPIFRDLVLEHLDELLAKARTLAAGTFVFEGTETWRLVYERLLRSPGLYHYRSVAWIKNRNYWQDEPGRKSMAVNFELHENEGLNVERIAIIADELWPPSNVWPVELIRQWLHEQHVRGIWTKFVRASALANEPDLIADIGIYGSRAVGTQELDDHCRTTRFTLTFDPATVNAAEDRWRRLSVYAENFASYLDRFEIPE